MPDYLFINCFPRLTPWLKKEVETLGYPVVKEDRMGVYVKGNYQDTYRLNYFLRCANKVLYPLGSFRAATPDQLYQRLTEIEWESVIPPKGYVSIGGFVKNDNIRDNRFAFMKVKDAIVDRIQERTGSRPDSGPKTDRTVLFLHWHRDEAVISIDTSGDSLARHGYRKYPGKAPMMEPLACAVLMATGWNKSMPFVNPMCGSGTLAIEAALMLQNKYPGYFRTNYGFMHTRYFDSLNWQKVKQEAERKRKEHDRNFPPVVASDHDERVLRSARANAEEAGVQDLITFQHSDFRETRIPVGKQGVVILNPEYGERLGDEKELGETYSAIGDFFKNKCSGYSGYIFTGNLDLAKKVGLRAARRTEFFNARIDCRLLEYELYAGTRRT